MEFTCEKKVLVSAATQINGAVATKASLPALEGILVSANGSGKVKLSSYDLDIGMTTVVDASVSNPGAIVLQAKLFISILKKMPNGNIKIAAETGNAITISSGDTEFTILGIAANEFPEIPEMSEYETCSVPQETFSKMIKMTVPFISTDESKPVHTGALVELSEGQIRFVATDGFRLSICTEKIENTITKSVVIPGKTLAEIQKLLEGKDDINVAIGSKYVMCQFGGVTVISRLLTGAFLDYKSAIIKQCNATEITVNTGFFKDSIDRASLIISDRVASPVRCEFDTDIIKISTATKTGRAYEKIPASITGNNVKIGFNSSYLLDALSCIDDEKILLHVTTPLSPMSICPEDGSKKYFYYILPVRLKN